jgi:tRNA threonylcarbamoyladenosine biosynthesis protein TsaE
MNIVSHSVIETARIGKLMAGNLKPTDIICLFGELGSGKTVLTKGIAQGLGIRKSQVVSPSFVLMRQHLKGRLPLYHFDLYRLMKSEDILSLGYEEYLFDEAVTVIEWADRLKYLLPKEYLKITLEIIGRKKRKIEFLAFGKRYEELIKRLKIKRNTQYTILSTN